MQDFVSIVTSFCARIYGLRRTKRKTEKIIEAVSNEER
jgi:predicted site-specific integrase-resolvase